jgi:predicted nucleic acid-binding protein
MRLVFADTVYYVAVVNPRDALHQSARSFAASYTGQMVTTEFVLIEVANFFCRANGRPAFQDLVRDLRSAAQVEIVPASADLFTRGFDLFVARPDKDWSLTDCTSFVVMGERKISEALTADDHFAQAGFNPLLKP